MSEHEHIHAQGEACSCGHHEHNHTNDHAHDHKDAPSPVFGHIHIESHLHDEARVISAHLTLVGDAVSIKATLHTQLEKLAKLVQDSGGIVGHIKASCQTTQVEMFSVTDVEVTVKKSPEQEVQINLAAIIFLTDISVGEKMVNNALEAIKSGA